MMPGKASRNRRLPDFLLVGAAKSATSSLHAYLDQHPQIRMPTIKESWFFSFYRQPPHYASPGVLSDVVTELDEYLQLFDGAADDQLLGDASPSYLYTYEDTIRNIRELYSEAALARLKIVIALREPVSRALSQYYTFKRKVEEPLEFAEAFREETAARRLRDNWNIFYDYTGFGMYSQQVEAFLQAFGPERVLILLYEDIQADAAGACRRIFEFLGVDPEFSVNDRLQHNRFAGEPGMKWLIAGLFSRNRVKRMIAALIPRTLRKIIIFIILVPLLKRKGLDGESVRAMSKQFREDILRLESLIERDLSGWKKWR